MIFLKANIVPSRFFLKCRFFIRLFIKQPCVIASRHCTVFQSQHRAVVLRLNTKTHPGMESQTYTFFLQALTLLSIALLAIEVNAVNYASVNSGDSKFELKWTYNNISDKLMFKMKCKGTGWCAVGFSTDPGNGGGMKNYDIAVGGVTSAGVKYLAVSLLEMCL